MKNLKILVVDDEEDIQIILSDRLKMYGYEISTAGDGEEALEKVESESPDLVLLDIRMPKKDGMAVLSEIKSKHPEIFVIMITAYMTVKRAEEAMLKLGAYDFIEKPLKFELIRIKIERALKQLRLQRENQYLRSELKGTYGEIIGKSSQMMAVLDRIERVAPSDLSVLITGETGTGKELVARALHDNSPRSSEKFIVVNCAAIQPTLVESELFGHEKGAFTGAIEKKPGKMELADGGTLFLDEVGDMAYELQAKLLRAIQEKEFERVGGNTRIKVDVRFIAATNMDLHEAMEEGKFRNDLFHRLNGVEIALPPLCEHKEDIPLLVESLLQNAAQNNREIQISEEAMDVLVNHPWPGNVRDLQNCIKRTIVLADSNIIQPEHLPPELCGSSPPEVTQEGIFIKVGTTWKDAEKALILKTYEKTGHNKTRTADLLGISLRTVQSKLKEYGEEVED